MERAILRDPLAQDDALYMHCLPADITAKLIASMEKIYKSPEFNEFMKGRGFGVVWKPGTDFGKWMADSDADLGAVMKAVATVHAALN